MRDVFPEFFYDPSATKLWKKAIFVPDTNVLLDIFRFSPETSRDLVSILKQLKNKDRLWIPYQYAHEYLMRLPSIRKTIRESNKKQTQDLDNLCQVFVNLLSKFDEQTDYELGAQIDKVEVVFRTIKRGLKDHRKKHKERLDSEDLEGDVEKIFKGRIGCPFSDERLAEVYRDGEWRYKLRRPPGFKDESKPESRRYGDLIGWLQIIEFANGEKPKRPIILVTRDSSGDDWFYKPGLDGKTQGPRPELVREMREKANVDFYIYQTGDFMELANIHLKLHEPVPESAIEEARKSIKASVSGNVRESYSGRGLGSLNPALASDTLASAPAFSGVASAESSVANILAGIGTESSVAKALAGIGTEASVAKALAGIGTESSVAKALAGIGTESSVAKILAGIGAEASVANMMASIGVGASMADVIGNAGLASSMASLSTIQASIVGQSALLSQSALLGHTAAALGRAHGADLESDSPRKEIEESSGKDVDEDDDDDRELPSPEPTVS